MAEQSQLTPAQRELLVELLLRERGELRVEIRHTRVRHCRESLRGRLDLVCQTLDTLQSSLAPVSAD